jgi:hypothetical protein
MINILNSKTDEFRTAPLVGGALDNSYLVARVDDGQGMSGVQKASGAAAEEVVGIAHVSPLAALYRAVIDEAHNAVDDAGDRVVQLNYTAIDVASVRVYNVTDAVAITPDAITAAGLITIDSGNANLPDVTDELIISYRRSVTLQELSNEGLPLDYANQINGSDGAVEFITGNSTVETDFFDTSVVYAVGEALYADADGMPTNTSGAGMVVGHVAVVPTAENPVLGISFDLKF